MPETTNAPLTLVGASEATLLERISAVEAENRLLRRISGDRQQQVVEREREQRRLETSENLARTGSLEWIPAGKRLTLSTGLRRILQIADDDESPRLDNLLRRLESADRQRLILRLRRLSRGGAHFQERLRFRGPRRSEHHLNVVGLAEFDRKQDLARLIVVCHDQSELDEKQAQFAQLSARYNGLLESVPQPLLLIDCAPDSGEIVAANSQFCRWLGFTTEQLLGEQCSSIGIDAATARRLAGTPVTEPPMTGAQRQAPRPRTLTPTTLMDPSPAPRPCVISFRRIDTDYESLVAAFITPSTPARGKR